MLLAIEKFRYLKLVDIATVVSFFHRKIIGASDLKLDHEFIKSIDDMAIFKKDLAEFEEHLSLDENITDLVMNNHLAEYSYYGVGISEVSSEAQIIAIQTKFTKAGYCDKAELISISQLSLENKLIRKCRKSIYKTIRSIIKTEA
jgi:hypothetical protein